METSLSVESVVDDLSHLTESIAMRQFQLPKFKVTFGLEISETLKSLGMELPFGPYANLSNMTEPGTQVEAPLLVSSVCHKAFVAVNEHGTEAAAVTAVRCMAACVPRYTEDSNFIADHPFMFLIKEDSSNTILFTGRVLDSSREQ